MMESEGFVYLLHFARSIGNPRVRHGTAQHYCGWAYDPNERLIEHRAGQGSALTRAAVEQGISFDIVQIWPGTRAFERLLKRRKATPRLCPICGKTHPRGPLSIANEYRQLKLPFDDFDDFDPTPKGSMDFVEYCGRFRRTTRIPDVPVGAATRSFDIPF